MNLYFRLLIMFLAARMKRPISLLDNFVSSHIVWPGDVDLLFYMNNGRYFTVTDVVRIEMLLRSGLWSVLRKRGYWEEWSENG